MTSWTAVGAWLLQLVATADTVLVKQVATDRGWFETVTGIASGLMTLALLVLAVVLAPAAWNFRKTYKKVSELMDRVYGDVNPIVRHLSTVADNVDYITTSIRVDIQQVNQTIASANQRINHAAALAEQRLNEFNALLQVVQREAEDTFVTAAATVRGVRAGAASFRDGVVMDDRPHAELPDAFDEMDDDLDEELIDGDDSTDDLRDRKPAPRIRPREGRRNPA